MPDTEIPYFASEITLFLKAKKERTIFLLRVQVTHVLEGFFSDQKIEIFFLSDALTWVL